MTVEKLNILEKLVDELTKDDPNESVVVDCMKQAGIPDTRNPIDRINQVLLALNTAQIDKEFE